MMRKYEYYSRYSALGFVFLAILISSEATLNSSSSSSSVLCSEKEKHALLRFKQTLTDPGNRLSSWSSLTQDCCGWAGVRCHNVSGHVVQLHLGNPMVHGSLRSRHDLDTAKFNARWSALGGEISPALLDLQQLNFLNLSLNDFRGTAVPAFLGSMRSLKGLDLWGASFRGLIPHQLGNLSTLGLLSLGGNYELYVDSFSWVSRLSSLEVLDMGWVDLHKDLHWLDSLTQLSSLSELYLPGCHLNNMIMSSSALRYANLSSLTSLHLPSNNFNHDIPNWLFNLTSLLNLELSDNSLKGTIPSTISDVQNLKNLFLPVNRLTGRIPESLAQLKHLQVASLHSNSLSGPIPTQLGNMSSLSVLDLSINRLNDTLPKNIGLLSNLVRLFIADNVLIQGTVLEVNFAKLSKLKFLDMSLTSVVFNVSQYWIPPFQLELLGLAGCKMGPGFPTWLQTQTSLQTLSLKNVGIVGILPRWFWKWSLRIEGINLGFNQISGDLSQVRLNNTIFSADSNRFVGQLPNLSAKVVAFTTPNNSLSGDISPFLCQKMDGRSNLAILDLSNNALSGGLPHCLMRWQSLTHLNLGSNNLSGKIPEFIGSLFSLKALHLHNNSFSGSIPLSLRDCTSLGLIDFGENKLTGNMPSWIGESTTQMMVIRLRSNGFFGDIPLQICRLSSLIVLDVADNRLSGSIPRCLYNISGMATVPRPIDDNFSTLTDYSYFGYPEYISLFIKGSESKYRSILPLVRIVDLSCNNLSGRIPTEISSLFGLQSLNLSRNHLIGRIPKTIGGMEYLESLDLASNHLSGEIPESITNLTFLSHLDLSFNNLSGKIPSSTQLQSLEAVDFMGNPELCGAPLLKSCRENELGADDEKKNHPTSSSSSDEDEDEDGEMLNRSWFYIGGASGFVVGFWGLCGSLVWKRSWRHAYFNSLNNIKDRVYVMTVLNLRWLRHHLIRTYRMMISLGSLSGRNQQQTEEKSGGES